MSDTVKNCIHALPPSTELDTSREAESAKTTAASLHGEILSRLRDYIVEGNLAGGARIPERQLCEMFGISRTPLREALKVLASEGLVDLLPNRGARVRELGARELAELFDVLGGLEALAGRLLCERMTEAEFNEIEQLHHQMYAFYLSRNMHDYFRCNQSIHQKIVAATGNTALSSAHASLANRLRRVRYAANLAQKRDRWGEAMREHEAILDCLRLRDAAELGDILFRHLRRSQAAVLECLEDTRDAERTVQIVGSAAQ